MNDLDLKEIITILLERIQALETVNASILNECTRKRRDTYINQVLNNIKEGE